MFGCGLRNASRQNAWVAAFLAIVLKITALPMTSAMGTLSLEQLLAGSFCSSGGVRLAVALDKDPASSAVQGDSAHCCCSQSIGAAPLGASSPVLPVFLGLAPRLPSGRPRRLTPRQRWPSINPRASPHADA